MLYTRYCPILLGFDGRKRRIVMVVWVEIKEV